MFGSPKKPRQYPEGSKSDCISDEHSKFIFVSRSYFNTAVLSCTLAGLTIRMSIGLLIWAFIGLRR